MTATLVQHRVRLLTQLKAICDTLVRNPHRIGRFMKKSALEGSNGLVFDRTDLRLLQALQHNAKRSDEELAQLMSLSPSGCRKRRRKLEDAGVIKGYVAVIDQDLVGLSEDVYVALKLQSNQHDEMDAFDKAVQEVEEVMECHAVAGEWDYMLRVVTRDMHDHDRLCDRKLSRLPGVVRLESFATMRRLVGKTALPL